MYTTLETFVWQYLYNNIIKDCHINIAWYLFCAVCIVLNTLKVGKELFQKTERLTHGCLKFSFNTRSIQKSTLPGSPLLLSKMIFTLFLTMEPIFREFTVVVIYSHIKYSLSLYMLRNCPACHKTQPTSYQLVK